ncbi:MAG TPA: tetratricopeptide repeat protein, partial [Verrucomicrobiae bacterium]|nr:tetratricopeptide repeat protein [Verrucomicrobiae bacterium]
IGRIICRCQLSFCIIACLASATAASCQTNTALLQANRIPVAVLSLENASGNEDLDHWGYSIRRILDEQLSKVKAIRMVNDRVVRYALRQNKITNETVHPIMPDKARQMGEIIEARRVVWGSYRQAGGKWEVSVRILNVASGEMSGVLTATGEGWNSICDQSSAQILKELGVVPAEEERKLMSAHLTESPAALDYFSRAEYALASRPDFAHVEQLAHQAILADPGFARAYVLLGAVQGSQGRVQEAETSARKALELDGNSSKANQILGVALLFEGNASEAESKLRAANEIDPEDPETLGRLGDVKRTQSNWDEAISFYLKAMEIDPFNASLCGDLSEAYINKGDVVKARLMLEQAEKLDFGDKPDVELLMGSVYEVMHETAKAVEKYEAFVTLARKQRLNPEGVDNVATRLEALKAILSPHYVEAAMPLEYSQATLAAALEKRLSKEELKDVVDSLGSTPEMKAWAVQKTAGATNDFDRAEKLFEALNRHIDSGVYSSRTAKEAFQVLDDSHSSFVCQDYGRLYVALARTLGLKGFFVEVDEDVTGQQVQHACACVFLDGKAFLADPAYHWFGVPHKKFIVLDDLQTVASQMSEMNDLRLDRIATKLQPGSAEVQFRLAADLFNQSRVAGTGLRDASKVAEGRKVMETALRLDSTSYLAEYSQGVMALTEGDSENAERHLRKALEVNSDYDPACLALGSVLWNEGKLKEAREQFRNYLRLETESNEQNENEARHRIALIDEKLGQ